jgi:hypothetical protein
LEVKVTNQSESYTRLGENSCGLNWLEALPIHQFSLVDIEIAGGVKAGTQSGKLIKLYLLSGFGQTL